MKRQTSWILTGILLAAALGAAGDPAVAAADNQGFIYGRVTMDSGSEYVGFLRWGTEEAFWDDLFHSVKEDLPYREEVDDRLWRSERQDRKKRKGGKIDLLIGEIRWESDDDDRGDWYVDRVFIARFGDIERIEVVGDDRAELCMKSGETYRVKGYSNDVGGEIEVNDASLGKVDLKWDRIDTIEFMPAPGGADPGVTRLYGRLVSDSGEFEGYIQWDKQECLSTDLLEGETMDGDVAIEMGKIQSIERRGNGAEVKLKDDRELRMRGTNDVNRDNRGIMVEDARYGRVTVPWDEFDSLVFSEARSSGRGYNDYKPGRRLEGTVTDRDGQTYKGRIVLDIDESEDWEMLNGGYNDIDFDIPLQNVRAIEPEGARDGRVELRNGEKLEFDEGQDATADNDGVLIYTGSRDPEYLPWKEIRRIQFD